MVDGTNAQSAITCSLCCMVPPTVPTKKITKDSTSLIMYYPLIFRRLTMFESAASSEFLVPDFLQSSGSWQPATGSFTITA